MNIQETRFLQDEDTQLFVIFLSSINRRHRGMTANEHIKISNNKTLNYFGFLMTNQNSIQEEIKFRFKARNLCYYSVQTLLSSRFLSKN